MSEGSKQIILNWLRAHPGWHSPHEVGMKALRAASLGSGFKMAAGPLKKLLMVRLVEVRYEGLKMYRATPADQAPHGD